MSTTAKTLERMPREGKIFGVCAGLSDYFGVDIAAMRIIFVVLALATGGAMIILYLILAVVMPVADESHKSKTDHADVSVGDKVHKLGQEFQENRGISRVQNYFGVGLLILGIWLLLVQFFPNWLAFNWEYVWPVILILTGLFVISRRR